MATLFGMFPFLQKLFADGGYQGPEFSTALAKVRPHLNVEIVKRSDRAKGFVVLSKRWIVGVSSEGHAVMSVKVRPELKDSGFEARRRRGARARRRSPPTTCSKGVCAKHQVATYSERRRSLVTR